MSRSSPVPAESGDAASVALRTLAMALLPHLRDLLATEVRRAELADVCAAIPAPRRTIMRACRNGDIIGAVRVGRRWLAPRGAIDAWLGRLGPPQGAPQSEDDSGDDLEDIRRALARPDSPRRRRRRR
jgi:hypothetical protein